MTFAPSNFLRRVLQLDAAATGATGLLVLGGMSFLPAFLNLPSALLTYAGIFCLGWALTLGFASVRERISSTFVWTIIVGNVGWVVASTALLLSGYVSPTWLGYAFVIAQALAVDIFAGLQMFAMWKHARSATA